MAYTFAKAEEIGKSLVDDSKIDYCNEMMEKAEKLAKNFCFRRCSCSRFPEPIDAPIEVENVSCRQIPDD